MFSESEMAFAVAMLYGTLGCGLADVDLPLLAAKFFTVAKKLSEVSFFTYAQRDKKTQGYIVFFTYKLFLLVFVFVF